MAVWIPVTLVPTSLATVAIDTFMTELSRVIRNWPAASVTRTVPAELARVFASVSSERSLSDIRLFQPREAARVPGRKGRRLAPPMRTWDPR